MKREFFISLLTVVLLIFVTVGCTNPGIDLGETIVEAESIEGSKEVVALEESPVSVSRVGASPGRTIVLCVDGFSNSYKIFEALDSAIAKSGKSPAELDGVTIKRQEYSIWHADCSDYVDTIRRIANSSSLPLAEQNLVLIGKSLGGARTFKMINSYASYFKKFKRVAVVLVDAHEPFIPGAYGRANRWYDYVIFAGSGGIYNYDLKMTATLSSYGSKLRIFNIYQREDLIRGYAFTAAYKNINLTSNISHFNIPGKAETINCIYEALNWGNAF